MCGCIRDWDSHISRDFHSSMLEKAHYSPKVVTHFFRDKGYLLFGISMNRVDVDMPVFSNKG